MIRLIAVKFMILYLVVIENNYLILSLFIMTDDGFFVIFFMSQAYDLVQGALVSVIYFLVLHFISVIYLVNLLTF